MLSLTLASGYSSIGNSCGLQGKNSSVSGYNFSHLHDVNMLVILSIPVRGNRDLQSRESHACLARAKFGIYNA